MPHSSLFLVRLPFSPCPSILTEPPVFYFPFSLLLLNPLLAGIHFQLNHKSQQNHHSPLFQSFAKSKWDILLIIVMAL